MPGGGIVVAMAERRPVSVAIRIAVDGDLERSPRSRHRAFQRLDLGLRLLPQPGLILQSGLGLGELTDSLAETRRDLLRLLHHSLDLLTQQVEITALVLGAALDVRDDVGERPLGLVTCGRPRPASRAIFGLDELSAGTISVQGAAAPADPAAAIAAGIGFLTEDRKAEGIVPDMSVRENMTLALLPRLTRRGAIRRGTERELVAGFIRALGIKAAHMDQPIRELSGGNQQKVLLARWLATEPALLLLDEPTRGVDVGAKREIQAIIRDFVSKGNGVVLISSEFEELVEGADRVVVLRDGRSVAVLENPGITEDALLAAIAHEADEETVA